MATKNRKSLKKEKRGVSPVLATMVMVGVAVAVGLGVASYSMGLFSNLSKTAQVSITSIEINSTSDSVTIKLDNRGGLSATLNKVEVTIGSTLYTSSPNTNIGASSSATVTITDLDDGNNNSPNFASGKTYTFTLKFDDGRILTATGTAT